MQSKALFFPFEIGAGEDGRSLENFKNMIAECCRIGKLIAVWLIRGTGGTMKIYKNFYDLSICTSGCCLCTHTFYNYGKKPHILQHMCTWAMYK